MPWRAGRAHGEPAGRRDPHGTSPRRADVADASVAVLVVVPTDERARPLAGLLESNPLDFSERFLSSTSDSRFPGLSWRDGK